MADAGFRYTTPTSGGTSGSGSTSKASGGYTGSSEKATTQASANQTQTSDSSGTRSATTNQTQQNMSPQDAAALSLLIQQLMGGGTQQMAEDRARQVQEIQAIQQQRQGYTKDAAFGDAQGAMSQQLRLSLEKIMSTLVRGAEGSGTSQSSMRALLAQQGAMQAAESSAALGLKAAGDYGQVSNGMSNVLSSLLNSADPAVAALLNALNISKGSVSNTQSTVNETTTNKTNTTGSSSQSTGSGGSVSSGSSGGTTSNPFERVQMMSGSSGAPDLSAFAQPYMSPNQQLLDLLDSAGGYTGSYKF